ncbi:MAG: hypothetical protein HRU15_19405, partial [Planctomycetes bacterium]|nr:hypothetical protein [Planctomycetota bacterium]
MLFTGKNSTRHTYNLWSSTRCAWVLTIGIVLFIAVVSAASMAIEITPTIEAEINQTHKTQAQYKNSAQITDASPIALRLMLSTGGSTDFKVHSHTTGVFHINGN